MIMRETIEEVELKEKPILRKETANNALKKRQEQKIWVEQGTYNGALNYHSFKRIESRVTRLRPQWDVLPSGVSLAKATCKLWLLWFSPCFLLRNKQSHRNISGASLSLSSPLPGLVVCSLQQPQNTQNALRSHVFCPKSWFMNPLCCKRTCRMGEGKKEQAGKTHFWGLGSEAFQDLHWNLIYCHSIFENLSMSTTNYKKKEVTAPREPLR